MIIQPQSTVDGVARCARYAFGPNRLHLCGPDANKEVLAYLEAGGSDAGLEHILQGFKTLYPYLQEIAQANNIHDPFANQVVEAYWIGNELLENIPLKNFYYHLLDKLNFKKRYNPKLLNQLVNKMPQGARMHHSFHVFNAYERTGHDNLLYTPENMDACRISWGRVTGVDGTKIILQRKPLILEGHHLKLDDEQEYILRRQLGADALFDELAPGQFITIHWNVPCEIVTEENIKWLEYYTKKHLELSNKSL